MNAKCSERLASLSTPHLADACLRVGAPVRCAPAGVTAVQRGMRCAGRALPVRHVGSVEDPRGCAHADDDGDRAGARVRKSSSKGVSLRRFSGK